AWSFECKTPGDPSCNLLCGDRWVSGGHVLVAVGYFVNDNDPLDRMVVIFDPWPPNQGNVYLLSYQDWLDTLSEPGSGGHATQSHVYLITNVIPPECPPGQQKVGGRCCPVHDACGSTCCDASDPPPNQDCGDQLCEDHDSCVSPA